MKHTPAHWKITENSFTQDAITDSEGTKAICFIPNGNEEAEANSKLICAAPDLLQALQDLMNTYTKDGHLLNFNVNIAREAIKKATE